jgi:hypothetical protein
MKYLAILKDSLRETLDSKLLYAMLIIAALVIVGVGSISFQPQPADQGLQSILARFPGARSGFGQPPPVLRYDVENFTQLNDAPPWEGQYRFDLAVKELPAKNADGKEDDTKGAFRALVWVFGLQLDEQNLTAEDQEARKRLVMLREQAQTVPPDQLNKFLNEKMRDEIERVTPAQMERFVSQQLAAQGTLEVARAQFKGADGDRTHFEVETRARPETFRTWPHTVTYLFGAIPTRTETSIGHSVFGVEDTLIGSFGAGITMLVATIITAFFIPNMLHKGTIDLLLAKPIHRWALLIYKFIGGLTFMFLTTVFIVLGIWLVLGLRSGLWAPGFLLSIFILTFQFAIFYSVSALFGVLTRSPIVSILAACFTWVVLWGVGTGYQLVTAMRDFVEMPGWLTVTVDTAHFVLPRYKDLDALNSQLIGRDLLGPDSQERKMMDKVFASIKWGESLAFSTGFIALILGLACLRFATKDY